MSASCDLSPLDGWPTPFVHRLANKLTLVISPLPRLHAASIALLVRVGSRFETSANNGVSHLLEHLLFRGCEGYEEPGSFNAAVESHSHVLGAATYRDFTIFDATCRPASIAALLDLIAAMVRAPTLADLPTERQVVLEELRDEIDDKGRDVDITNVSHRALFPDDSLGLKIGGELRVVKDLSLEDCQQWHRRSYGAANMVLSIAGPVDPDQLKLLVQETFETLPEGRQQQVPSVCVRPNLPALEYTPNLGSQVSVEVAFLAPAPGHPDWAPLLMAQRLLDDGTAARLPRRVIDTLGLAYYVSAGLEEYVGQGLFVVNADIGPANTIPLLDEVLALVRGLGEAPISAPEWQRLQARLNLELELVLDSAQGVALREGLAHLYPKAGSAMHRARRLVSVTREQVQSAARRWLRRDRMQVSIVGTLPPIVRAAVRRRVCAMVPSRGQALE